MKATSLNKHSSPIEELANSITHGAGVLLSIAGLVVLLIQAVLYGNVWHVVSGAIFGTTLVILYLASTLYHSFSYPPVKLWFKKMDHAAIYLLIAGTYTPCTLASMGGSWGWSLFASVWLLAISGIIFKFLFIGRLRKLSVIFYVIMGWLCVIALKEISASIPGVSLALLIGGGISYTTGIVFYGWHKLPFNHAIWHLFVLGGSILHYFSVLKAI